MGRAIAVVVFVASLFLPLQARAGTGDTGWMSQGKYGIFLHYQYRILLGYSIKTKPQFPDPSQMTAEGWNRFVDGFDVKGFARQTAEAKVGWVIFCLDDHYFAWPCAPNRAFSDFTGYAPGEKCSRRDLILDLADALNAQGVRLICYFAGLNGYMKEPKVLAGLGEGGARGQFNDKSPPSDECRQRRLTVLKEYADRYKDKIAGWWFDGMGRDTYRAQPYDWRAIESIVRGANPKAVIAFSYGTNEQACLCPGVDDYTGGDTWSKQDLTRLTPQRLPAPAGILWHGKIYCGNVYHGQGDANQFSDQELIDWINTCNAQGGVCTLDWPFDPPTGLLKDFGLAQLKRIAGVVKQEYWVSPTGSDTGAGTRDKPFATPHRARDALREARKGGLRPAGVTVWLRGGVYRMDETLDLNAQDSGTAGAPVVYRSVPGEEVRLVGGKPIPFSAFKPVTDPDVLQRLDPSARGNVLQVDLGTVGITDYGRLTRRGGIERSTLPAALELFFNDRPMPLARWPNQGWTRIAAVPEGPKGERFRYEGDRPRRWRTTEDIWVHGYMNRNWCDTYEQIAVLDAQRREVVTREPHDYRGYKAGQRFRFLNVLEELDEPGEWYVDKTAGTLYFWPSEPLAQGRVWASLLESPLVALRHTEYVTLEGLVLECTRGCGVEIIGGRHNRVARCILRNIGTVGVTIGVVEPDLERRIYTDTTFKGDTGTDNGVVSCEIHDTGEYGIILAGGDRKTLDAGRNFAVGNDIHHFGRWVRTYRPAIFLCGVGNRVAHNRLHDAPHTAVLFWGNEHLLEFNEVYRVCTDTGDAGAFYIGRDWSQRGNVIRYNYFHDLAATLAQEQGFNWVMGVYLDDQASGMIVFGNVFNRVNCGVMVGGGRDNAIANNLFAFCGRAISLDARGLGESYSAGNTLFDRLQPVHHDRPPYSERYPALARVLDDEPGQPRGNEISHNICVGGPWNVFSLSKENEYVRKLVKLENNLTEGDAGLAAPEKGDFRLKEDSPARKLGFQPIPCDQIGPLPHGAAADPP